MTANKTKNASKKAAGMKPEKKTKPATENPERKMSALDAAAKVLKEKGVAMTCPELIGVMAAKGYWSSPDGKTPAATLASAIIGEISTKGDDSRFAKTAPGRFADKGSLVVDRTAPTRSAKQGKGKQTAMDLTSVAAVATEVAPTPAA